MADGDASDASLNGDDATTDTETEHVLRETLARYTLFPIKEPTLFEFYKNAVASFWTVEEVDLADDVRSFQKLSQNEQHFVKHVLAFFAASDGIVAENLALRFYHDVQLAEARAFLGFQLAIEQVHSEMYSLLIDTYVDNVAEKNKLFNSIENSPTISTKAMWASKWISSNKKFAERLIAFAAVEGIFFSASFCAIYWLKKQGKMPGLTFSNELISRDEGMHRDFACALHACLQNPCDEETARTIVKEAVDIERDFCCEALPVDLLGMNSRDMTQYVQYVADHLMTTLGFQKIYKVSNPFDFMELISLQGKTNFFEKRVGDYKKANVGMHASMDDMHKIHSFSTVEDF